MLSIFVQEEHISWSWCLWEPISWLHWVNDLQILEQQFKKVVLRITLNQPLQSVLPPLRTILENRLLRRSRSTLLIESTTTWWTPAYSWPISSGLNNISGARKRSGPSYKGISLTPTMMRREMATCTTLPSGSLNSSRRPIESFSSFAGLSAT